MADRHADAIACRRVELAVSELERLSVPPCIAVQYLTAILEEPFSPTALADLLECEPALAASVLSLAQRKDAGPAEQRHSVRLVLDRLDCASLRDTLLAAKVRAGFEIEFAQEQPAVPARTDLILHSLAVACGAGALAEAVPTGVDSRLAYTAGLLHDVGKFALQDIMPKSLAAIVQEAEATGAGLYTVEQQHLGTNHALLGRQLAQRWRLPEGVALAIWLHHEDAVALADGLPEAGVASLVWAADHMARQAEIGRSGSYDTPAPLEDIAAALGVDVETLQQVQRELPAVVKEKSAVLGLDVPHATARYCDLLHAAAADLSRTHTDLARERRTLKTSSAYLDFAEEFLRDAGAQVGALDVAEDFARRWQRFFQTGSVCVYLAAGAHEGAVDAVIVEALGHSRKIVLEAPSDAALVPGAIAGKFALPPAVGHINWLAEQLETDLDLSRTRLVPLLSGGRTVAVMACELNYPGDVEFFAKRFAPAASMAGTILGLALDRQRQQRLLERFVQLNAARGGARRPAAQAHPTTGSPQPVISLEALAEMAAGVAHELNNPLSVIAGRAQLLAEGETDKEKKRTLKQIQDNVRGASGVVEDLMSFAEPPAPRPAKTRVRQIIDEAVELAGRKTKAEHVNAQVDLDAAVGEVLVDSAQIVSALANVIANSIESYADTMGPVKIGAEPDGEAVRLQVGDLGCGMDAETLRKATQPFFSARPAGRKRGMGLAYAIRLIRLNRGTLGLESRPDQGTTVTITLPTA